MGAIGKVLTFFWYQIFSEFIAKLNLSNKFQNEHLKQVEWAWADSRSSDLVHCSSYINLVLVRNDDFEFWGYASLHNIVHLDNRLDHIQIYLYRHKPRMVECCKFNTSLLNVKDFWDQLILTLKQEWIWTVVGNKWWSFVAEYSFWFNLDILAPQKHLI